MNPTRIAAAFLLAALAILPTTSASSLQDSLLPPTSVPSLEKTALPGVCAQTLFKIDFLGGPCGELGGKYAKLRVELVGQLSCTAKAGSYCTVPCGMPTIQTPTNEWTVQVYAKLQREGSAIPYSITTTAYGDCIKGGPVSVTDTTDDLYGVGKTAQTNTLAYGVIRCVVSGDAGYGECRV